MWNIIDLKLFDINDCYSLFGCLNKRNYLVMCIVRYYEIGLFCVFIWIVIDYLFLEVKGDLDVCNKILINDCVK